MDIDYSDDRKQDHITDNEDDEQYALVDDEHEDDDEPTQDKDQTAPSEHVQIFFCSRTHSQLSQVVNEVRNTVYGPDIRIATLASRQHYCVNPAVRKFNSVALINERCLEMQKSSCCSTSTKTTDGCVVKRQKNGGESKKCSYYAQNKIASTHDLILTKVLDIEELVAAATDKSACPYYASRLAAKDAQLVMLSYQMLLHRRTRLQNGLDLRGSIVIIDEGHNLIDTISSIYSTEVTLDQLRQATHQLDAYKKRYFSRFSTKNLLYLNQLMFITTRLVKLLECPPAATKGEAAASRMVLPLELLTESEIFTIRINEILEFCERTRLAQKVQGFSIKHASAVLIAEQPPPKASRSDYLKQLAQKMATKKVTKGTNTVKEAVEVPAPAAPAVSVASTTNAPASIRPLLAFLDSLVERHDDARVLLTYSRALRSRSSLKYLLLNPAAHFADVLSECRAVSFFFEFHNILINKHHTNKSTKLCTGYCCRWHNAADGRTKDTTV